LRFCCNACLRGDTCVVFCALSVVSGAVRSPWSSAARLTRPLHLDIHGRQNPFGLLLRLGMMVRAQGQNDSCASGSSHWATGCCGAICTGVLDELMESRAWRGRERGRRGVEGTCVKERGVRSWITKRCLLSSEPLPSGEYSIHSLLASFQLSKNTVEKLGQSCNTPRHTEQCQDQKYATNAFLERTTEIDDVLKLYCGKERTCGS